MVCFLLFYIFRLQSYTFFMNSCNFFLIFVLKMYFYRTKMRNFDFFLYFCTWKEDGKEENHIHIEPNLGYSLEG